MQNDNKLGRLNYTRQQVVTLLFLSLSQFNVRSCVLYFIKTLENCRHAPRLAEKHSVIWISSLIYKRNWRCSVVFFNA